MSRGLYPRPERPDATARSLPQERLELRLDLGVERREAPRRTTRRGGPGRRTRAASASRSRRRRRARPPACPSPSAAARRPRTPTRRTSASSDSIASGEHRPGGRRGARCSSPSQPSVPRQGGHQVAQNSTSTARPARSSRATRPAVEVGERERGQRRDLRAPSGRLRGAAASSWRPAQEQLDHAREVGPEALVALRRSCSGA